MSSFKKMSKAAKRPAEEHDASENIETDAKYKQRVLLLSSRGILSRQRHLMQDLASLLPHCKKDAKLDTKSNLRLLNELADLNNCNNCIFFESRKGMDLYMWLAKTPNGPSAKFHVQNIHTMDELKLTGNCLKGSRPVLSFDQSFDSAPHFQLLKEMFTHAFAVPKNSRRVKPFIDHVTSLSIVDNRVWFRTYQIIEKDPEALPKEKMALVEVGPRFCLNLIRIFGGSFSGSVLYENKEFISPNMIRSSIKVNHANKYVKRKISNAERAYQMVKNQLPIDPLDKAFA